MYNHCNGIIKVSMVCLVNHLHALIICSLLFIVCPAAILFHNPSGLNMTALHSTWYLIKYFYLRNTSHMQ